MHLGQAKCGQGEGDGKPGEMGDPVSLLPVPQSGCAVQAVSSGLNNTFQPASVC